MRNGDRGQAATFNKGGRDNHRMNRLENFITELNGLKREIEYKSLSLNVDSEE